MTKRGIGLVVAIAVLFLGVAPAYAWWHGPHAWVGAPFWYPYPYYAPPVVVQPSPRVVVPPSAPPTYVERRDAAPAESYWYYCESSKGYYPYVTQCPGGWKRVAPTAHSSRQDAVVRIGWFRSVINIPHAFAVCSFADELAHAAGRDPRDYLLVARVATKRRRRLAPPELPR